MNTNKIRKNDKVILNVPFTLPHYTSKTLPVGTELIVWKAKQDGTLLCSCLTTSSSVTIKASDVTKVVRNCPMPKVGDVFSSSWGYEQTNQTFFQVVGVRNKSIVVREIGADRRYDGPMCGHAKPLVNKFVGDEKTHVVKFDGSDRPYFKWTSFAHAWPTDPSKEHFFSEWH